VLDREEIALLVRQGEQLIAAGDIAAARIVFQRASEAGDAAATVALAATYDPAALKQIGVVGKHADVAKARSLYEKAERLGSAEATRRLQMLARQ
jgi:TPR repeat protein